MNPIRALITLIAVGVLAVGAYFVYHDSERLFKVQITEQAKPAPQVPASEALEINEAASAAVATSATPAVAAAPAEVVPASVSPAPSAKPASAPASADSTAKPAPKPIAPADVEKPKKEVVQETKPAPERSKEIQLIIKEIKFTGVTLLPEKELSKVVSEFIGKELTVDQAFAIPAKIANHYKRNNHMAIATLSGALTPEGVLTIGVVEMQMSQTQADKELATLAPQPAPTPATSAVSSVASVNAGAPTPPIPSTTVPVATASSAPPVTVPLAASAPAPIAPTTKSAPVAAPTRVPLPTTKDTDSETDYILKNYAKKSRQYELMVDNYGHEATGSTRVGAGLSIGGDQLSLVGFKSSGSDYLRMAVNWITGIDGLKVGAHVSNLKYEVVNHLQTAMYQSGDAVKRGVSLIYELVNETSQYSTLALKFDSKSTNAVGLNFADSTAFQSWVSNLEYKGIVREMIPGGAVFSYDLSYAQGHVDITGASNIGGIEVDEGPFSKLRLTASLNQPLGGLGSVFAGLTLQRSRQNLDPSERFYLGGPTGVRAYGVGEGYGSEGELATLEFRQRLGASTTLSEFYDWGRARLAHNRNGANNITTLSGYGISLSQEVGNGTTIKGTWARSHGNNNPLPLNPNGNDNVDRNRFWLSMETRF